MNLRGITLEQFASAVATVNSSYAGNLKVHQDAHEKGVNVKTTVGRLTVEQSGETGSRTSWTGRRTQAACWHAFRDVIRQLLAEQPNAVITTRMARYTSDTFEILYPKTAGVNIGSEWNPAYMPELCDCP